MSVNEKMTAIADAIRDKTGGTEELSLDAMAIEIPKVYDSGAKSEYDRFWDTYQSNGKVYPWATGSVFAYEVWNDKNFFPKYDIRVSEGDCRSMFLRNAVTNLRERIDGRGLKMDLSHCTSVNMWFREALTCELPDMDTSKVTIFTEFVIGASNLHTIPRINVSKATYFSNTFARAPKLQNITFEGTISASISFKDCPLLTLKSLKSIITALTDYAGTSKEFTYTLTLNSASITILEEEGATAEYTDSEGNVTTMTWIELIDAKKWNLVSA